jgi:hypothetical protein
MDCAPENTREPRTGASARAFRVAVLDESYASAESFTLRGKVFAGSCGKKLYGTVPCTRPPGRFSFLDETPHPCHSDAQACSHSCTKLPTLVIPTPSPVLIPGRNSPPSSFRRPGLFSFLGETLHPCHSDAKPVLIPGRNSPPLSFRRPGLFSFLGETLHPCHSDAERRRNLRPYTLLPNRFCDALN